MKNWVGVGVVLALLAVGFATYTHPDLVPGVDAPRVIYLLMALLLVAGAGFGFRRLRTDKRTAFLSVVAWLALIAVIALVYVWIR